MLFKFFLIYGNSHFESKVLVQPVDSTILYKFNRVLRASVSKCRIVLLVLLCLNGLMHWAISRMMICRNEL